MSNNLIYHGIKRCPKMGYLAAQKRALLVEECRRRFGFFAKQRSTMSSLDTNLQQHETFFIPRSSWATVEPEVFSNAIPAVATNIIDGQFVGRSGNTKVGYKSFPDPMNKNEDAFLLVPETSREELVHFLRSRVATTPKSGAHNPFKRPERYLKYGDVTMKLAEALRDASNVEYFAKLIQRVAPKSSGQASAEVVVTRKFLENFAGDNVRFLSRGFSVPGDHVGQMSHGYRWPYGKVCIITPFNFPLEIPVLQLLGALYMGNRVLLHVDSRVSIVMEQFLRLMHACGMPAEDVDLIHCDGEIMGELLEQMQPRMTLFTGSQRVAERLATQLKGKVKLEDAGFDWKILGPDASKEELPFVAYQCDQDAYACSGQKCSAQSILFAHANWMRLGICDAMESLASKRNLSDLTVGPVLTKTTEQMLTHVRQILTQIEGSKVLFGGKELPNHNIPERYGALEPTAVLVPLQEMLKNDDNFELVATEIFGPFQIVVEYDDATLPDVLKAMEKMENHLTAAIVSNDVDFRRKLLSETVNGTTYVGNRARTTGAPQNHWFGPCGDPRAGGIGTKEAIQLVWSSHREIIVDDKSSSSSTNWTQPAQT